MKKEILLYPVFERFWHWSQALLIILLVVTGFGGTWFLSYRLFRKGLCVS